MGKTELSHTAEIQPEYDALLVLSFGGPEQPEEVIPFLENVLRGRNVPRQRMMAVAEHYYHFGGRSPINDQCRALIRALEPQLDLPIYWGNRNWHPLVEDTLRRMTADGVRRALVFVTSAYSSYSACRQYLDDIERARVAIGPGAPECEKLRHYHSHPGFVEPNAAALRAARLKAPGAPVLFTAHSIPVEMARTSRYAEQLEETARLVAAGAGVSEYRLVYQSRSGPPAQPWLEPDILQALKETRAAGAEAVVVSPIGFISDHLEVLYDLDYEAGQLCADLGMKLHRAATVGTSPQFIEMIRELVEERRAGLELADPCREGCCPAPIRPGGPASPGRP
ncbi:MAG: ferrochelatase [Acidobacteria bacterium]|nr:ferrochelatase [Acidobacteriota bacterium]